MLHSVAVVLAYAGLLLATFSSIWGATHDLRAADASGAKRLTSWGKVAIAFTLAGLVVSVGSRAAADRLQAASDDQRRKVEQQQRDQHDREQAASLDQVRAQMGLGFRTLEEAAKTRQEQQMRLSAISRDEAAREQREVVRQLVATNEVVVAGQPLTSLSLHLRFASANPALWAAMKAGQAKIRENDESEQGGSPRVPYVAMEYDAALLPLVSYLGVLGAAPAPAAVRPPGEMAAGANSPLVVLIPLDESKNAIMSFGDLGSAPDWSDDRGDALLSAGFSLPFMEGVRTGDTWPQSSAELSPKQGHGMSHYAIDWALDPVTLANATDRRRADVPSTGKLPRVLRVVILYGNPTKGGEKQTLPFRKNNFAVTSAVNLWSSGPGKQSRVPELRDVSLTIQVNGLREGTYRYRLNRIYGVGLTDEYDDDEDIGCTILEFEAT
jgi:hypothetical protein